MLSVVVGASVCGGVGGALCVVRSGCTGERSKLMGAAGRVSTAKPSGSSLLAAGGTAARGEEDGRGLDGRDCGWPTSGAVKPNGSVLFRLGSV